MLLFYLLFIRIPYHCLMNPALQILATMIAGWLNEQQQLAIEYLKEENRVLREQLGDKRILLNDNQRRSSAVKGKIIPPKRGFVTYNRVG
ncbi:MAG: hypothetical protein ACI9ON_003708 [Limisphaerales bacterium]|jgi:hypothetical protein